MYEFFNHSDHMLSPLMIIPYIKSKRYEIK